MQEGDLDTAGALAPDDLSLALRLAGLRGQDARVRELLAGVPLDPSSAELAVVAAEAALSLDPPPDDLLARLDAACALQADPTVGRQAVNLCAWAALRRAVPEPDRRSPAEADLHLPFALANTRPLVAARLGDGPVRLWILDTGAGLSVLTRSEFDAAQQGGEVPGTEHRVSSDGGELEAVMVRGQLKAGDTTFDDFVFTVIDTDLGGLAGILSPQQLAGKDPFTLDFQGMRFHTGLPEAEPAWMPMLWHEGQPYVRARVPGGPARPFLVDSGADLTTLYEDLAAASSIAGAGDSQQAFTAGGEVARQHTSAALALELGRLKLDVPEAVVIAGASGASSWRGLLREGIVGTDLMMGRQVVVDRSGGRLGLSPEARLPPREPGQITRWRLADGCTLAFETVDAATPGQVKVDAVVASCPRESRTRLTLVDSWGARQALPLQGPLIDAVDGESELTSPELMARWSPFLPSFQPSGPPRLAAADEGPQGAQCLEVRMPVVLGEGGDPGTFRMVQCASEAWPIWRVELTGADGERVWDLNRVPEG